MLYFSLYCPKKQSMKTKFEIEFPINSSPQLLFQYISSPSGLSEWFADNVNSRGEIYTFIWEDSEEKAKLTNKKSDEKVRFRWIDEEGNESENYFELKIVRDEITKDVILVVTDFADEDEVEDQKLLWESKIHDLKTIRSEEQTSELQSREILIIRYYCPTYDSSDLNKKSDEKVRFRMIYKKGNESENYFELKIVRDEITKDVILVVTDFADEDEVEDQKLLWESQIHDLKTILGSN